MNPVNTHCSQESSSSPSIMRIPRNMLRNIPDAMPRKVRMESRRRSSRVNTYVKYTYDDPSSADSPSDLVVPLRKNIESESPNSSAMGGYPENSFEDDPPTVVPTVDLCNPFSRNDLAGDRCRHSCTHRYCTVSAPY
ncbi:hypothetical protein MKX03_011887, partial [Papaver bracteatum]